jgi:protein phosphatase
MHIGHEEQAPKLRVTWCGRSSTGKVRRNNEDSLWAAPLGQPGGHREGSDGDVETLFPGMLLAVADGMGGALAGEVASGLAVETLGAEMARRSRWVDPSRLGAGGFGLMLKASIEAANATIRGEGESNPKRRGMGTTLTAAWLRGADAEVAQIGDSRAYLFRKGHLSQLTKDQSLVGKLIEDNIISEEEAERMAGRNIILQALGTDEPLDVVHQTEHLEAGDTLLLCTDGLTSVVNNKDLQDQLRLGGKPCDVCERLVALANERGGPDNVTVLVARAEKVI